YAIISFIDRHRQWVKACHGNLPMTETERDVSFCGHTILEDRLFVVTDAAADPTFADNPLVYGRPGIRFYAGMPLVFSDGLAVGTLCVFDPEPGQISPEQAEILRLLASQVTKCLEFRIETAQALDVASRANRAKSQFLANISHELRTPLNGILGVAELMQDKASGELLPLVQTLNQSSRHLLRLLNDLLDLAQIESGRMSLDLAPLNLKAELQEVTELFRARATESGTELRLQTRGLDGLWLTGDATRIKQILMNLVSNAVKHTEQGEIRIEATASPVSHGLCTVALSVSDDGPGIPPADQQRVFGQFEQLDNSVTRAHGGSGLGLSISQQLLRLMGSELALESQPGQGARFYFELTLAEAPPAGPADKVSEAPPRPEQALIVDDNDVNRRILSSMLGYLGVAQLYSAGSARRGLAILDNVDPDVVFVDIQMPGMDGYGFLAEARQRLRESGRRVPAMVACTAHAGQEHRQRCLDSGFDAHLEKPVTRKTLQALLNTLPGR
ncbi:MAG: ATP-binding protein, partial [Marinobacter sp.]